MNAVAEYLAELVLTGLNQRVPDSIPEGIMIDELVSIAFKNHMIYLIAGGLLKTDISEEDKAKLRPYVVDSVIRTSIQISELKLIEKRFEEEKIVNQPMKGSCLKYVYPTVEMREMGDIDILVREDCMEKATRVLRDLGYTLIESIHHHDIYQKGPFMVVEAHRAMYDKAVDEFQYEYFKDFTKRVLKKDCSYSYDFTLEDFYIYMISHMAKHFYKRGCGIRNLIDIYVYRHVYGDRLDEDYLDAEFTKCGLSDFVHHMETLSSIWLDGETTTPFYDNLFSYMLDAGIYGKDENGIWNQFAKDKYQTKPVGRAKLRIWYILPPVQYMIEDYPWLDKHPVLLPWAWMIRAVNGLLRKKGTYKRRMLHNIEDDKINMIREIYQKMNLNFNK